MKEVYLTVDDGPSPMTCALVDYLVSKNIPAMFFCRGDGIVKNQQAVVYAIEHGMVIGNHGYTHKRFSKMNLKRAKEEISFTDQLIDACYTMAGMPRPMKVFRFPYGDRDFQESKAIQDYLHELGYEHPDFGDVTYGWFANTSKCHDTWWTFDSKDYSIPKTLTYKDALIRLEDPQPSEGGSMVDLTTAEVLLVHDHERSHVYAKGIIDLLHKRGYRFITPIWHDFETL
jgi:peptidoglycan-N-acetylglucosamine deacetylase